MALPGLYIVQSSPASRTGSGEDWSGSSGTDIDRGKDLDDRELFRRFLLGDDGAFEIFYGRHTPQILVYCRKMLNSMQGAQDVVQETWIRAINLRTSPPKDLANPVGLVVRIARNLCLDEIKAPRTKRRVPFEQADLSIYTPQQTSPGEESDNEKLERLAIECLNRLDLTCREPLILHLYCGHTYEEIAVMLDASPAAIWKRASRGRKKLKKMLEEEMRKQDLVR